MKHLLLIALVVAFACGFGLLINTAYAQSAREQAVVEFQDKTEVGGVVLQGKYLVVHDKSLAARGEPCLLVYKYEQGKDAAAIEAGKPVVAVHCHEVTRKPASDIVMTVGMASNGEFELREIQFGGSDKGHQLAATDSGN
jgi:hypothetical protein